MSDTKDPAIKLFGKTISLPLNEEAVVDRGCGGGGGAAAASSSTAPASSGVVHVDDADDYQDTKSDQEEQGGRHDDQTEHTTQAKDHFGQAVTETEEKQGSGPLNSEDQANPDTTSGKNENPRTPSVEKETAATKSSQAEEEQSEASSSQEKTILKKPDKILPCPRCNSMDTKFCYYNNYNVNQPRHFCKNCQRYWTAGGTMRNVPVGAGRRKNKNTASHYRQITVSEALQSAQADVPNGIHHPTLKPNGTILTFGTDAPLCESIASVLNLAEKTMRNCTHNGFHKSEEERILVPCGGGENGDESSNKTSITVSSSMDEARMPGLQEATMPNCHGFPPQIPCFPGAPWPYPWNNAQWTSAVPPPGFCPSNYPMSFYPAATYWGCPVPGAWSIPWLSQSSCTLNLGTPRSGPNSPLGKHTREGDILNKLSHSEKEDQPKQSNPEGGIWIPKTLRIDDPGEAARSSIWATLGIKNDKSDSISGGGLFKAFQSKGDEKNEMAETNRVLHANPAAMSRSMNFRELS